MEMDLARMSPLQEVRHLVVHTEGSPSGAHGTAESVNHYHIEERGWAGIGYHVFIEEDGAVRSGRPLTKMGAGVKGFNAHSLHICCSGNGDMEPFNPTQRTALIHILAGWLERFSLPIGHVLGHRECYAFPGVPNTGKTCPGKLVDMAELRTAVAAEAIIRRAPMRAEIHLAGASPKVPAPDLEPVIPHPVPAPRESWWRRFIPILGRDSMQTTEPKRGIKTTEFWVTVLTSVVSVLVAGGVVEPGTGSVLTTTITGLVAALGGVLAPVAYIWSRTRVKEVHKKHEAAS